MAPLRRVPTPRRFLRRGPHRTSVSDAPFRRRAPISSVCAASQNRPLDAVDECSAFRGPAEAAERLADIGVTAFSPNAALDWPPIACRKALLDAGHEPDKVCVVEVDHETVFARTRGRLIDPLTGRVFHKEFAPCDRLVSGRHPRRR